jgi:uncharacterized protein (DUF433 family)
MASKARGIRLPEEIDRELQREAERTQRNWSQVVVDLLEEALRMRRAPGVVFTSGPTGRRASIAGTGLDVWEIIAAWEAAGRDDAKLSEDYPWLEEEQLRAALSYYELYPSEIDARLERERRWTTERVREELPFTRPREGT